MGEARMTITECSDPDLVGVSWATDDEGNHHTVDGLTFARVSEKNSARASRWHPGFPHDDTWSGADWSNAMCGEAGEAANIVKKLRRYEDGLRGVGDPTEPELLDMLADEVADVFLYLDLLAAKYAIDVPAAIVRKFNVVSERQGFPERLP